MLIKVETSITFNGRTELEEARRFEEGHKDWQKHECSASVTFTKIEQTFTVRGEEDE